MAALLTMWPCCDLKACQKNKTCSPTEAVADRFEPEPPGHPQHKVQGSIQPPRHRYQQPQPQHQHTPYPPARFPFRATTISPPTAPLRVALTFLRILAPLAHTPDTVRYVRTMTHGKDILIALTGVTGAGKTTFASVASGRTDLEIGYTLKSCGADFSFQTAVRKTAS